MFDFIMTSFNIIFQYKVNLQIKSTITFYNCVIKTRFIKNLNKFIIVIIFIQFYYFIIYNFY
jgi:hypothetical protein